MAGAVAASRDPAARPRTPPPLPPPQLRTSRNFCLDVTLLAILLALGLYIYKVAANK